MHSARFVNGTVAPPDTAELYPILYVPSLQLALHGVDVRTISPERTRLVDDAMACGAARASPPLTIISRENEWQLGMLVTGPVYRQPAPPTPERGPDVWLAPADAAQRRELADGLVFVALDPALMGSAAWATAPQREREHSVVQILHRDSGTVMWDSLTGRSGAGAATAPLDRCAGVNEGDAVRDEVRPGARVGRRVWVGGGGCGMVWRNARPDSGFTLWGSGNGGSSRFAAWRPL